VVSEVGTAELDCFDLDETVAIIFVDCFVVQGLMGFPSMEMAWGLACALFLEEIDVKWQNLRVLGL
jgi:hypothetical protein